MAETLNIAPVGAGGGFVTRFEAKYPLGKQFSFDNATGRLVKKTLGELGACDFSVLGFDSAQAFAALLGSMTPCHALTTSTPRGGTVTAGRIVTKANFHKHPDALTRGKQHFGLQRGLRGVMTVDYDPEGDPLSKTQLWAAVREVIPGLDRHGAVYWVSGSSLIYRGDDMLQGVRGQRIYMLVQDVGDIPRAMVALQKRLWLAGHGRIFISSAGSLLLRTIADAALGEEARLDFVGGAVLLDGLEQRRGAPEVLSDGGWLDTAAALPDLSAAEERQYTSMVEQAKREAAPEAEARKEAHATEHAKRRASKAAASGGDYAREFEAGLSTAKAAHAGVLMGDFEVELDGGEVVTVGKILDDKTRFHGRMTLDPLEPEYAGRHLVGHLNLFGATPNLYSHAHGGRFYRLARQPESMTLEPGRTALNAVEFVRRLAQTGEIFQKGGVPVRVLDGLRPLAETSAMALELGTRFAMFKVNAKGERQPADPSDSLVRQIVRACANPGGLPELNGYIRHPFVTETEVVATPGFHADTGVFAEFDPEEFSSLPAAPSREEIVEALATLWRPWSRFAFASGNDRAAALAAILGVVCRPGLDIAPGILVDAPSPGSGKTFLASSLGALAVGSRPDIAVFAYGETDVELKKRLVADSIAGVETFIYDNVIGNFNSAVMAGLLTTGRIRDRVLSQSVAYSGPGPRHVILTANNLTLGPDLAVRFLRIRLDHGVANPASLAFDFHPVERTLEERGDVLRACLVVMRAFQAAGSPHHGDGGYRMAAWDRLVRSAVIWLGRGGYLAEAGIYPADIGYDPAAGLLAATADVTSGDEVKAEFFEHLQRVTASDPLPASEILGIMNAEEFGGNGRFHDTVECLLNGRKPTRALLRNLLEISADQICGGRRLRKDRDSSNVLIYWVQAAG